MVTGFFCFVRSITKARSDPAEMVLATKDRSDPAGMGLGVDRVVAEV